MRARVLLLGLLALIAAGSAAAASSKPKLVRVVKREGAITATLTYKDWTHLHLPRHGVAWSDLRLSAQRTGYLIGQRSICPRNLQLNRTCPWFWAAWYPGVTSPRTFRIVPARTPIVVADFWVGGVNCCKESVIGVVGTRTHWITRNWGNRGYQEASRQGRTFFVSGDTRFTALFGSYASSYWPTQVWTVNGQGHLVNVTRRELVFVRADARTAWRQYLRARHDRQERGLGRLAGWCADEYTVGLGNQCSEALHTALVHGYLHATLLPGGSGPAFIRTLNRDLERWGYKSG